MASKWFSAEEVARFLMELPDYGDVSDEETSGDEGDYVVEDIENNTLDSSNKRFWSTTKYINR